MTALILFFGIQPPGKLNPFPATLKSPDLRQEKSAGILACLNLAISHPSRAASPAHRNKKAGLSSGLFAHINKTKIINSDQRLSIPAINYVTKIPDWRNTASHQDR